MNETEDVRKKVIKTFVLIAFISLFTVIVLAIMDYYDLIPKTYYKASDFNIKTIYSTVDFNNNKYDDYSDFVNGARKDAKNHPTYVSKYYDDAYPPDNEGVCTDVIWRAFKEAGYSLKEMVDLDIKEHQEEYDIEKPDPNIDFRRVTNLDVFFKRNAVSLTTDPTEIEEWQPGDIVIFTHSHIGIISDRRNKDGIAYVIHNSGQIKREEDYLKKANIKAHYRFDAALVDEKYLIEWEK